MLGFFRRYQRFFFVFVTVIVALTMTVFGTYYGFKAPDAGEDPVVFTSIDKKPYTRGQLGRMILFLSSDEQDKSLSGGAPGANFLNDGVIRHDFLESGLAAMLGAEYLESLQPDLRMRTERERSFKPYTHAHARFLSAETVWSLYAPSLLKHFQQLKGEGRATSAKGLQERIALYLEEQKFPQFALKHVLRYQENQYQWLPQDPYLYGMDLSLFGYHSLEDWFGPRFIALVSEFIINAGAMANQYGYKVSPAEAFAELQRNAQRNFQANPQHRSGSANAEQYLNDQLRKMGLDRAQATAIWQQVMLFRRLFQDVGNAALVDLFSFRKFHEYADEAVDLQIYSLPETLHLPNYQALQAFETYLDAVCIRDGNLLAMPTAFRSVEAVKTDSPELVQRRFTLHVASVPLNTLAARIPVRDLWNWQLEENHWPALVEKFPALRSAAAASRDERFRAMEALDRKTRLQIDKWTQIEIVKAHPEWVQEALDATESKEIRLGVALAGQEAPLPGLKDRAKLLELLSTKDSALNNYTEDGQTYYRIDVVSGGGQEEIMTFAEAKETQALEELMAKRLGERGRKRDEAADSTYGLLIDAIYRYVANKKGEDLPKEPSGQFAATHRFCAHLDKARENIISVGDKSSWVATADGKDALLDQWKVVARASTVHRHDPKTLGSGEPFAMADKSWSPVFEEKAQPGYFFTVADKKLGSAVETEETDSSQGSLATDAKRCYMRSILDAMTAQGALSLQALFPSET